MHVRHNVPTNPAVPAKLLLKWFESHSKLEGSRCPRIMQMSVTLHCSSCGNVVEICQLSRNTFISVYETPSTFTLQACADLTAGLRTRHWTPEFRPRRLFFTREQGKDNSPAILQLKTGVNCPTPLSPFTSVRVECSFCGRGS